MSVHDWLQCLKQRATATQSVERSPKLLFFRGKDLVDLERLVAVQGAKLDSGYVRRHLVEMMGEDDVRVAKWDELVRDFSAGK